MITIIWSKFRSDMPSLGKNIKKSVVLMKLQHLFVKLRYIRERERERERERNRPFKASSSVGMEREEAIVCYQTTYFPSLQELD